MIIFVGDERTTGLWKVVFRAKIEKLLLINVKIFVKLLNYLAKIYLLFLWSSEDKRSFDGRKKLCSISSYKLVTKTFSQFKQEKEAHNCILLFLSNKLLNNSQSFYLIMYWIYKLRSQPKDCRTKGTPHFRTSL